jgi:hypothetical protein
LAVQWDAWRAELKVCLRVELLDALLVDLLAALKDSVMAVLKGLITEVYLDSRMVEKTIGSLYSALWMVVLMEMVLAVATVAWSVGHLVAWDC